MLNGKGVLILKLVGIAVTAAFSAVGTIIGHKEGIKTDNQIKMLKELKDSLPK